MSQEIEKTDEFREVEIEGMILRLDNLCQCERCKRWDWSFLDRTETNLKLSEDEVVLEDEEEYDQEIRCMSDKCRRIAKIVQRGRLKLLRALLEPSRLHSITTEERESIAAFGWLAKD